MRSLHRGNDVPFLRVVIRVPFMLAPVACLVTDAHACDYTTLRDAAFTDKRDVHRLCVIANGDDPAGDAIHGELAAWFEQNAQGLNVELMRVAADDSQTDWEKDFGFPSAPTAGTPLPAVALVGRISIERRGFFIDAWEPAPSAEQLNLLKSSPAREAIRDAAMRSLAVLVYFPGTDKNAGAARKVIDAVVGAWTGKESIGLSVVRVDRSDEKERLLLSFAGVEPSGPDRVVVVFGRGKFMRLPEGESLEGEQITEDRLNALIKILMEDCTCSVPPRTLGVDLPMTWNESLDEKVVWLYDEAYGPGQMLDEPPVGEAACCPAGGRMLTATAWTLVALLLAVTAVVALVWRHHRRPVR